MYRFDSGLLLNLTYCKTEFNLLQVLVAESRRKQGLRRVKNFASKVQWVYDEKKIARFCQRLEMVGFLFNIVLSLNGRKDNQLLLRYCNATSSSSVGKMVVLYAARLPTYTLHSRMLTHDLGPLPGIYPPPFPPPTVNWPTITIGSDGQLTPGPPPSPDHSPQLRDGYG